MQFDDTTGGSGTPTSQPACVQTEVKTTKVLCATRDIKTGLPPLSLSTSLSVMLPAELSSGMVLISTSQVVPRGTFGVTSSRSHAEISATIAGADSARPIDVAALCRKNRRDVW